MKISKSRFWTIVLVIAIVIPTFNNFELTFAVWALVFAGSVSNQYSREILRYTALMVIPVGIAFFSALLFKDYPFYGTVRDFTYLTKPILGLLIGYQIIRKHRLNPFGIIIYGSLAIALIHYIKIGYGYIFLHMRNLNEIRELGGYFSDFEVYGMIVLIFNERFGYAMKRRQRNIYLLVISLSVLAYFSRTNFIQLAVLLLAMLGYFRLTKRALYIIGTLTIVALLGYWAIYASNPRRNGPGAEAFLYKVKIAPTEPFKTRIKKDDWKDFNDNYRSFENILTMRQVGEDGLHEVFIGKGLGSTINLGRQIVTNDNSQKIRSIPFLHNSYMTIYLKAGILGVLTMLIFLWLLLRQKKSDDKLIANINYLLIGTGIFLILSNWVFLGLYFKVDNKALIIGFLLAYKIGHIKQSR